MQAILLSCLFGVAGTMVLWVAGAAAATREQLMRSRRLSPPEEL
jgi:hypothetical protein